MAMNKIRLEICGAEYPLSVEGDPAYYKELGKTLDARMRGMMEASDRVSVTRAAVLCALDYLDNLQHANGGADNLRNQLTAYLEDARAAQSAAEEAAKELESLRAQLQKSQLECEKLRKEVGYMHEQKS